MEILFHRYGCICEPDIIDAFKALGFTVLEEDIEIYQKSIAPKLRIQLLAEQILTHQISFVFSINFFPYISEICQRFHILYVCLSVDCPVLELFSASIRNSCNRIFLFDYNQYLQFKDENPEHIFYLPLGTNTDRWDSCLAASHSSTENINSASPQRWLYDISFVGSLYTEKTPYCKLPLSDFDRGFINGLIEAQLKLPGLSLIEESLSPALVSSVKKAAQNISTNFYSLPDAFTDTDAFVVLNYYLGFQASALERIRTLNALANDYRVDLFTRSDISSLTGVHCHGGVSTHQEMPQIFFHSKINLNITIRPIQTGISQRIWDILGCHGFLLSNYHEELPEYLKIGSDLDCYESIPELKEKISFYLQHEDIRLEIADHGYQTVKEKHTCLLRVVAILKTIYPA